MADPVNISSTAQFSSLLSSSTTVVADFHAEWCGPCKAIAPVFEQLSKQLSRPNKITFARIDVDQQKELASVYGVSAMPTFMVFKNGRTINTIKGADPKKLSDAVQKLAAEASADDTESSAAEGQAAESSGSGWMGAGTPKGYGDITDQVDIKGIDLLNCDSDLGSGRTLFDTSKPSGLATAGTDKGKGKATQGAPDWVESDTDEQLMLYVPFQSSIKVHSLHITSLPPSAEEGDDDEDIPMRPKNVQIYSNRSHVLGFEEAEDIPSTQTVTINPRDWDPKTGTAKVELRFVKFQNVTSLVIFFVDGDGEGEKLRVDRLKIIGEAGEKRDMGKLEKIGDEQGE